MLAIKYIHSLNVAHRDIKLENILIDQTGHIKISDFGLSKLFDSNSDGLTSTPCGSLCFASPECLSGEPYDAKKSDLWSCGVILYAMATGLMPWTEKQIGKLFEQIKKGEFMIPPFISDNCADLIRRLMTVDVDKRITEEEVLNHPFLKDVVVPKEVTNKKELLKEIEMQMKEEQITDDIDPNLMRVRKETETEDEMKMKNEEESAKINIICMQIQLLHFLFKEPFISYSAKYLINCKTNGTSTCSAE